MTDAPALILASTSPYRRELLARLGLPFRSVAPEVDEAAVPGEVPRATAVRLARAKAEAVAALHPGTLVIGSDQVADLKGQALGKPGSVEVARIQLAASAGHSVLFHTAVCVVDARAPEAAPHEAVDTTRVVFRTLAAAEIARYLAAEPALDCAGSFKAEGLGISLFERIEGSDPTALVGLPLIALTRLLREAGLRVP